MSSVWWLRLLAQNGLSLPQQHDVLDLVRGSGIIVQLVLYLLVSFSIASWAIIFYKFKQMRKARKQSETFTEIFWDRRNLSSIHDASRELKGSPVAQVFRAGYEELVRVFADEKRSFGRGGIDNGTGRSRQRRARNEARHQRRNHETGKVAQLPWNNGQHGAIHGLFGNSVGNYERIPRSQRYAFLKHSGGRSRYRGGARGHGCRTGRCDSRADGVQPICRRIKVLSVEMDNFAHEFLNIAERHFLK